jgi:hypothetical protein
MTIIVIRDADGEAWINLGNGKWALASDVMRGKKYAENYQYEEWEIEDPVTEWETE